METLLKLSPAQSLLLRTAARRADGRVIPPDTLRGGARVKVLTALLQRGWIEPADDGHVLTDAGYAAISQQRPVPPLSRLCVCLGPDPKSPSGQRALPTTNPSNCAQTP